MSTWSAVNRPVTLGELAASFAVPLARLERIVRRHRIAPAFRLGRIRLYGPEQVRRIYAAV